MLVLTLMSLPILGIAQGPPINSDKPIMLSEGTFLIKTLIENRVTDDASYTYLPLMVHYISTRKTLVALHVPFVSANYKGENIENSFALGDIVFQGKYQFLRKDQMGKTFRMVAKTLQTFGTGKPLNIEGMSTGRYQSYLAIVAGYESIKYGLSHEIGYNIVPSSNEDELRWKVGAGLPLLKPVYPVNQINLYFEYAGFWYPNLAEKSLFYSQGFQYARDQVTIETAIQFPVFQDTDIIQKRKYSLYFGTRFVF